MISRRDLIGCSVAASALGLAPRVAGAVDATSSSTLPLALVVVDERFDAARSAARALAGVNVPRVALTRDVFDLWHRRLEAICSAGTHAFGGVTTERGFFLLQTLAADHRLRVLSRAALPGSLLSWTIGP